MPPPRCLRRCARFRDPPGPRARPGVVRAEGARATPTSVVAARRGRLGRSETDRGAPLRVRPPGAGCSSNGRVAPGWGGSERRNVLRPLRLGRSESDRGAPLRVRPPGAGCSSSGRVALGWGGWERRNVLRPLRPGRQRRWASWEPFGSANHLQGSSRHSARAEARPDGDRSLFDPCASPLAGSRPSPGRAAPTGLGSCLGLGAPAVARWWPQDVARGFVRRRPRFPPPAGRRRRAWGCHVTPQERAFRARRPSLARKRAPRLPRPRASGRPSKLWGRVQPSTACAPLQPQVLSRRRLPWCSAAPPWAWPRTRRLPVVAPRRALLAWWGTCCPRIRAPDSWSPRSGRPSRPGVGRVQT